MKARPPFWFALAAVIIFAVWRLDVFAQEQDLGPGARFVPRRAGGVMLRMVFFDEAKTTLRGNKHLASNPLGWQPRGGERK